MSEKFDAIVAKATENDVQVDVNAVELPNIRPLGATYLEENDRFLIEMQYLFEDKKMRKVEPFDATNPEHTKEGVKKDENGNVIKTQVFYLVVRMVNADGSHKNQAKKLYLTSLCKTLFEWVSDGQGGIKRTDKPAVHTEGDVPEIVQKAPNFNEALKALDGKFVHVAKITDVSIKKFGTKDKLDTGHVMTLETFTPNA